MPPLPAPCAVLFVSDLPRLTSFYRSVASMTLSHGDDQHSVLDIAGFQLVVHAMRWTPESDGTNGDAPPLREDACIKLCFPVERIDAARSMAASLGGSIQPPDREWTDRGIRACDGADPEGNVFQVRELVSGE
jgi:predicted enzyme related to lactoylglutathione lyase